MKVTGKEDMVNAILRTSVLNSFSFVNKHRPAYQILLMETQFLPFDYGNKKKLEEKLNDYLGSGNYEVVEVRHQTLMNVTIYSI
jgi:hypothetical protein